MFTANITANINFIPMLNAFNFKSWHENISIVLAVMDLDLALRVDSPPLLMDESTIDDKREMERHTWWIDSGGTAHISVYMQGYMNCRKPNDGERYNGSGEQHPGPFAKFLEECGIVPWYTMSAKARPYRPNEKKLDSRTVNCYFVRYSERSKDTTDQDNVGEPPIQEGVSEEQTLPPQEPMPLRRSTKEKRSSLPDDYMIDAMNEEMKPMKDNDVWDLVPLPEVDHSSTTDDQTSDSNLAVSDSHTETDTESSVSTSDSEKSYADITRILMAQPNQPPPGQTSHTEPYVDIPSEVEEEMPESSATNQPPPAQAHTSSPSQKSSNGPWFTFDDLPSHKWRDRLNEMSAWIDLQMLRPGAITQSVLREFATRFTGALRDWFDSLGNYRQLQFVQLPEVSSALAVIHDQFLGDPSAVFEAARRDYLNMKCCSLNTKDLDFYYKRMSLLFYKLNGFNEPTLKHVFLASLPDELQPDIQRQLTASNLSLHNISLGKIFQLAKTCLDKLCEQKQFFKKLCEQKQFFKELLKDKEPFRNACKKPYLQIKCKQKKDYDCSPKKKRHFKKFRNPEFHPDLVDPESLTDSSERSHLLPETLNEENQADVSSARRKTILPKTVPTSEKNLFDEPNDETAFALQNSSDDSNSDQSQISFHQQLLSLDTTIPIPSIKLQILPSKFQRPIPAIGLIDTGAQRSMLNPHLLPPEYWTDYEEHFKAVNGKLFTTSLITKKPIGSHDEHRQLLTQFYEIVHSYGIMLSTKKSTIATDNIEFIVQQFLGIINYIRDFIPHVDHYTHHLSALLKKKPPEWNTDHTNAVTTLKQIAQNPPPLKLITNGKRILQTDASDDSWGAILLEETNGKEHFIAYASGQFSDTQKHYHSVFKEILAVKNGIKKFEYHLIGHHFLIRMDSSVFPNILNFKGKTVPKKMLLRLKDWFSKYDFSVKHIKGSQNLIPDILSRLSKPEKPLTLFSITYHFPIISMATSLPLEAFTKKTFPFNKTFSSVFAIQEFARKALFRFFMKAYLVTESFPFSSFHPENLFLTDLTLDPSRETTEDVLWYLWCLTVLYATKLVLPITPTLEHLLDSNKATSLTWTLLEWFSPIPWWRKKLQQLSENYNLERMPASEAQMFTSVFIIHRPYFQHPDTKLFWTQDQDPHPNLPKLTRPLNPPKLTKPLKHPLGQDTAEIVLIPITVVPTAYRYTRIAPRVFLLDYHKRAISKQFSKDMALRIANQSTKESLMSSSTMASEFIACYEASNHRI
ncbi:hypothetical protein KPL71_026462 [Citrus sinensis]|uniref:Uncharacterized protein n=1 Tax=Citrus sinensis TaxID=2711 RepID=A0ACB8HZM1_CITSI|nr:hypothetical protein KPL71_026462 [Citrus sinensis]